MMSKFKYSINSSIKFFKKEWGEYRPLKYFLVDILLVILGGLLIFIPTRGIEIVGFLLIFFGLLGILSPLLILFASFWYFILTMFFPIEQKSYNNEDENANKSINNKIENRFKKLSKWKSVSEIPGFPFDSFQKLKDAIRERKYTIGVDYSAATQFAPLISSGFWKFTVMILAIIPWITLVIAVISAIILKNYYLLFGIPIVGLTFALSNPLCPFRNYISVMGYIGTICLIVISNQTTIWLFSFFIITFWDVRILYRRNTMALRQAVMDSEPFFIYNYEKRGCTIKNNQAGEVYIY